MYKHILIPTDGSEIAGKGVQHGLELAKALGAAATVLTVTVLWGPLESARKASVKNAVAALKKEADEEAQRILDDVSELAKTIGTSIDTVHETHTSSAAAIVLTAAGRGCDLIVMSSHGRRGIQRAVLGSQTAEVLTTATVPVLVAR
jgi:nucleotide-binding universal stress UspA family protein